MATNPPSSGGPSTFRFKPSASSGTPTSSAGVRSVPSGGTVDPIVLSYVDAKVDAVRAELGGELKSLESSFKAIEAQRTIDYNELKQSILNVAGNLPTKDTVRNYVLGGFGAVIAALALGWAVFDTGAGLVGSVADRLLDTKEAQSAAKEQQDVLSNKMDLLIERTSEVGSEVKKKEASR